ncbi:hypothetical protein ASC64_06975 [Nocardioides sp. Root122]|nr:hypothetical protein ASC64_06975 [Nocardioides sp. Root122]
MTDLEQRDDRHGTGLMAWVVLLDVTAKVVLVLALARVAVDPAWGNLEIGVAAGMTLALWWEVWEYLAFVTRSSEVGTAYADTVGDLTLGWAGAVVASLLVGIGSLGDRRNGHDLLERAAAAGTSSWRARRVRQRVDWRG